MTLSELFNDNALKAKGKVETVSTWLVDGSLPIDELLVFAEKAKDAVKGSCIEAIEFVTQSNPNLANEFVFDFMVKSLLEKAPRVKWESAKVIGNIAPLFPLKLNAAITNLLINANYDGTVVRWASAYALGEILKMKTKHHSTLRPTIELLCHKEENNGVKKKYLDALKKSK